MTALLDVAGVTKRFGGLVAVKDVSFALEAGEITGILGPNGAGKTTLFNLLTGFMATDRGIVRFEGRALADLPPHRIVNLGLARTFQLCRPFRGMSVLENASVGCLAPRVRHEGSVTARAQRIL
jgi:branched-chain amino acid transport system ATP-binding protein